MVKVEKELILLILMFIVVFLLGGLAGHFLGSLQATNHYSAIIQDMTERCMFWLQ